MGSLRDHSVRDSAAPAKESWGSDVGLSGAALAVAVVWAVAVGQALWAPPGSGWSTGSEKKANGDETLGMNLYSGCWTDV